MSKQQIAVIGGGSWATAIVKILSEKDVQIHWWVRSEADREHIMAYGHNPRYLRSAQINTSKVSPTGNLALAIEQSDTIVIAVPSAFLTDVLRALPEGALKEKRVVSAIKGMVPDKNMAITQYLKQFWDIPYAQLAVIAGPCHAEEVAMEKQSYLTIASEGFDFAREFAELMTCRYIRSSPHTDIKGVEFCAIMKNIIAIACGIAHGLGFGDNFQAVLVSNSVQEIQRFLNFLAASPNRDLNGSAYLGDLLVTTYSNFSRNRTFGNMLGRGYSVKAAQMEMEMIAEGFYAVKSVHEINKTYQVNLPITEAVYNIVYERISPIVEYRILKDKLT